MPDEDNVNLSKSPLIPAFLRLSDEEKHASYVDLEWKQQSRLTGGSSAPPSSNWRRLSGPNIAHRNRYSNVVPFANNRIRLEVADGINDYINASPIVLDNLRFITTQGPLATSISHFYRMVAAETGHTAVIVMLTKTHESRREKCFQYFPLEAAAPSITIHPDPDGDDDFECQVDLLDSRDDQETRSTIRHCRLRSRLYPKGRSPTKWQEKELWHVLFSAWPDFGVPQLPDWQALMALRNLSRELNTEINSPVPGGQAPGLGVHDKSSDTQIPTMSKCLKASSTSNLVNPRIVHCSAGVGRTGTFIALDYLLDRLESGHLDKLSDHEDPIAQVVDDLRQQRMMMVQTETQYFLLYDLLRQAWETRAKRLSDDRLSGLVKD